MAAAASHFPNRQLYAAVAKPAVVATAPQLMPCASPSPIQFESSPFEYLFEVYFCKYESQKQTYCPFPLANQAAVSPMMRSTLLHWLAAVNRQFQYSLETFCLTVSLFDRFLYVQPLHPDCLQLAGMTALFLAAKLEEVDPPEVSELVSVCAKTYDRNQFHWMERIMLTALNFRLVSATPGFFLDHMVEYQNLTKTWPKDFSRLLVERSLCLYELCGILPSQLAHAIFDVITDHYCDSRIHKAFAIRLSELTRAHEDIIADYMKRITMTIASAMQQQHHR